MKSLAITKENLDNQRNAVHEERRLGLDNQPYGKSNELIDELAYDNPAYEHSVIGSMADLNAASVDDVASFFKTYYAPNNAVLSIVGDVVAEDALGSALAALDGWRTPPPEPVALLPPAPIARRQRLIAMPGKLQTDIAYGFTAVRRLDPRYYAYWMMNNILGQFGLGGRLADNIRERQGMAYYAFSTLDPAPLVADARGVRPERRRPKGRGRRIG